MAIGMRDLDSQVYRKLFEFAQKEGVETLVSFMKDYEALLKEDSLTKAILYGKYDAMSFVRRHKAMTSFLRRLELNDVPVFLQDRNFLEFVYGLTNEAIPSYIEGARSLEELGVGSIVLVPKINDELVYRTTVFYGKDGAITDIVKQYTNGEIRYKADFEVVLVDDYKVDLADDYKAFISFPTDSGNFVISTENHENGFQYKYARVSDFGFNPNLLPSNKELSSYEVPQSLKDSKVFVKRI